MAFAKPGACFLHTLICLVSLNFIIRYHRVDIFHMYILHTNTCEWLINDTDLLDEQQMLKHESINKLI